MISEITDLMYPCYSCGKQGAINKFIWTCRHPSESYQNGVNVVTLCLRCMATGIPPVSVVKCVICCKKVTTCGLGNGMEVDSCVHCMNIPFLDTASIIHATVCSNSCHLKCMKKVKKEEGMLSTRLCGGCFKLKEKMLKCSRCKRVYYCGVDCQKSNWSEHKTVCRR